METIQGSVTRILFSNEQSGYKVLSIRTLTGSPTIMTGEFGPEIIAETMAKFHGDFRSHPKYGTNFRVASYEVAYNAEELTSIRLFIDAIAPTIGAERSKSIVEFFGRDTLDILDHSPDRLIEVDGIGEVTSRNLTKAWKENRQVWSEQRQIYSLRAFLYNLGIKERRVRKILGHFGNDFRAEEIIRENPYILCTIEGFGFTTVDHIALRLEYAMESPKRLKAFLLYILEKLCPSNGHLFLELPDIVTLLNKYCQENLTKFLNKDLLDVSDLKPLLSNLEEEKKIVCEDTTFYYAKNLHEYESRSAQILINIMTEPSDLIFLTKATVEDFSKNFEKENGLEFSPEQKEALHYFAEQKIFIITGAAGSGKTTILKAIVELTKRLNLRLTCMTPTGISAKKLSSTVNNEAYTIHRRLGFRGNQWTFNENNPFETDVVIIDEASMIDQETFFRLVSALRKRTHIVIVGDHNQLPPVSAGNVLRDLIKCDSIPTIKLEKIFRQSAISDIIRVAHQVKNGNTDMALFKSDPSSDVFFLRMKDIPEIEKFIISLATKFKKERRSFQIICPKNDGPLSVNLLNKILQETLNPPSPDLTEMNAGKFIIRRGDRVIVRKNDYENDVFNGDIGKVMHIGDGRVSVQFGDRFIEFPVEDLNEKLGLAYIISTHRSQGQEYPFIILPFINQYGKFLLQRNLLYTAITRAKEKVIIIGHGSALERAILNDSAVRRNTRLGEKVTKCLNKKNECSLSLSPKMPEPCPIAPVNTEPPLSETEESFLMDSIEE